ncbi:MAG TPA: phosphotransferase [Burkholderiales bacterium]|nr:phosphotransferase [Burkholderiales bacterium]
MSNGDLRFDELREWVSACLGRSDLAFQRASEDASFRRYFRVSGDGRSWIVMDAPPEREDCRPFVKVARLMHAAGVHVPEIIAEDIGRGYLLLSDLGTKTYLAVLNETNADALFSDALDALVKWQLASKPGTLPPYDEALLRRELLLFPEWYLERHLGVQLDRQQRSTLETLFARLIDASLAQPKVYVHRDYMPRNLMLSEPNPGVLDFQDAVYGSITYDVVSLFRDAFLSWPEARVLDWSARYWERARKAGLPVHADFGDFYRAFEWMGLQRHLKVLGIFARIHYRDGKPGYLEDTPRFLAYARPVAERYSELSGLVSLLDIVEKRAPHAAYTF